MKLPGRMSQVRSVLLSDHMMLSGPGFEQLAVSWPGPCVYLAAKGL